MDSRRFDAIARALAGTASRRLSLKLLAGGALGAVLVRLGVEVATAACVPAGKKCGRGDRCCAGATCKGGACKCDRGLRECGKVCKECCADGDCPGRVCRNGTCRDRSACAVDSDCQSGHCCNGSCVDGQTDSANCGTSCIDCGIGGECRNGGCCRADARACSVDTECCSGVCRGFRVKTCQCRPAGSLCETGGSCRSCCNDVLCEGGGGGPRCQCV